ncbi:hypothetical protein NMG60_11031667 [Bertholletia excelsa]
MLYTFTTCSHQLYLSNDEVVHGMVMKSGFESNLYVGNAIIGMYYVSVKMELTRKVFNEMSERRVFLDQSDRFWYGEALGYFEDMLCDDKVKANEEILVSALSACTYRGALDQGNWIHAYMGKHRISKC